MTDSIDTILNNAPGLIGPGWERFWAATSQLMRAHGAPEDYLATEAVKLKGVYYAGLKHMYEVSLSLAAEGVPEFYSLMALNKIKLELDAYQKEAEAFVAAHKITKEAMQ